MRKLGSLVAVAALAVGAVVVWPASAVGAAASGDSDVTVTRYGGTDRYATSLLIAEAVAAEAGGSLSSVVLVSGERWTDAVVAATLSGESGAAVLMTPPDELRADALGFLQRMGVTDAVVIGPEAGGGAHGPGRGVGTAVLDALAEAGIAAQRVAGSDRYSTSVAAANEVTPGLMPGLGRTVIIASGEVFADALVAGPFAARGVHPVLLSPPDELPAGVASYLSAAGIEHVVVMGGTAALSADVEESIADLGVEVSRLAGKSRFDTAVKAAELVTGRYSTAAGQDCFATSTVGLARARVPFDSFSAAPLLSRLCAPLVLADPSQIPADTAAFLDAAREANAPVGLRVFGGNAAVSQAAIDAYLEREDAEQGRSASDDSGEDAVPTGLPAGTCGGSIDDEPSQLLDSNAAEDASWSPDCSQIVYTQNGSLWTMNNDGSGGRLLVRADGGYLAQAAWSPDGAQIAYVRDYWDGINGQSQLWTVNDDGSAKTKLSRGDVQERWPAWSPDGTRIVFEHASGSGRDANGWFIDQDRYIVTMDADGRNRKTLNTGSWPEEAPTWSPGGELLAFTSAGVVQVSEVDGSNRRAIIAGSYWNGGLSFSPDGRRIAFVRGDRSRSAIHVANTDGTDERVIFDRDVQAVAPRWSPDGQRLLFHTIDDENRHRIYVAGAGGDPVRDTAAQCKPRGAGGENTTAGFPLSRETTPSVGTVRVAVLFMDYPDAQATHTTQHEASFGLSYVEDYLEAASYGLLDVELVPHHEWLRAEHSYTHYADVIEVVGRSAIIWPATVHAVELADDDVDFSDIDMVLHVSPSTHFDSGNAHRTAVADGATLRLARVGTERRSTTGEPFFWGHNAAHELTHLFGLLDLYPYDARAHDTTGAVPHGKTRVDTWWGLMGLRSWFFADSTDPRRQHTWRHSNGLTDTGYNTYLEPHEMLAWSRWQLGWLDESQVRCVDETEATVSLSPIAQPSDGVAMAAVPLNAREVIVIESRRKQGYDLGRDYTAPDGWSTTYPRLITEGVLVYTVDSLTQTGELPLKVAGDSGNGMVDDFPVLQSGESVTIHGYTITVTADDGDTHTVNIARTH